MSLPADEFVEQVRLALGARNANDLTDKLGLGAARAQTVRRWLKGENEPDYGATMLMLKRVGWLQLPEDLAAAGPKDPLEAIAESVSQTLANQEVALAVLEELRDALVTGDTGQQAPPKRRGK